MDTVDGSSRSALSDTPSTSGSSGNRRLTAANLGRARTTAGVLFLLTLLAASAFWTVGFSTSISDVELQFSSVADALTKDVEHSAREVTVAGMWVHQAVSRNFNVSINATGLASSGSDAMRLEFRYLYDNVASLHMGDCILSIGYAPNVTQVNREAFEDETRRYYRQYRPDFVYNGFQGYEPNDNSGTIQNRSLHDFYFPVHWLEPFDDNEENLDFDLLSSSVLRTAIQSALSTRKPSLTSRLEVRTPTLRAIVEEPPEGVVSYGVVLVHPGIPDPMQPEQQAKDVAVLPIHIVTLLERSFEEYPAPMVMYAFDITLYGQSDFLGGAEYFCESKGTDRIRILPEISLESLTNGGFRLQLRDLEILDRKWKIVYVAPDQAFVPTIIYILLGGILIMSAGLFLSVWVYTNADRQNRMNRLRAQTESEKAAVIIEAAQKAMRGERELNDFIAHEVRNPLAAAMSASSFVTASVNDETKPFSSLRAAVNEDLRIIDNALHFINDLLRNMLDMQRAHSNQLSISYAPVDILQDVFSPVDAMLYRRGDDIEVQVECPPNLVIMSDRLRLKQIVLNLGRNSLKFVNKGFIRLRAIVDEVDNSVLIYIEDSGPGIPVEKRKKLFAKFQESLDSLHQGTGIGLCLCLNLMDLMGGEILLDEDYDSGIPGQPGTRFVIRLNCPPLAIKDICLEDFHGSARHLVNTQPEIEAKPEGEFDLPNDLSLLFVDDDMVLRKLFARAIAKIMPHWKFQEAANGEAALKLMEDDVNQFDLIFVDQYMASAEKQLLGTETVRAMRAMGVSARICGLSANDVQHGFEDAGANAFMFKPFPTNPEKMKLELTRILACRSEDGSEADGPLAFQKPRESLPDDNQTSSLRKRVSVARDPISEVL